MQRQILRPALGQTSRLGTLYDARTDSFLPTCILNSDAPPSVVKRTRKTTTEFDFSEGDSPKDRFNKMGLNTDLQASYLSGFVNVEGSGRYLNKIQNTTTGVVEVSMYHRVTVMNESLQWRRSEVADLLASSNIDDGFATHIVVGITWGAHSIVTAKFQSDYERRAEITTQLKDKLALLAKRLSGEETDTNDNREDSENPAQNFEVHVDSDVLPASDMMPTTFDSAYRFLKEVPQYISKDNQGNGKPVMYALMALETLAFFHDENIVASTPFVQLSEDMLEKFVNLFAYPSAIQLVLSAYNTRINEHQRCIAAGHIKEIEDLKKAFAGRKAGLRSQFATTLRDARAGQKGPDILQVLLQDCSKELSLEPDFGVMEKYTDKMNFFDLIIRKGVEYVGYSSGGEADTPKSPKYHESYTFRFNWESQYEDSALGENIDILLELLGEDGTIASPKAHIIVNDCGATGERVDQPCISHERSGEIITKNLVEKLRERGDKSFMQYDMANFENGWHKRPKKMRKVTLACPGKPCSNNLHDWICYECQAPISFDYVKRFLYCNCGRGFYSHWTFQCHDRKHGGEWFKYEEDSTLLKALNALEPLKDLNILLLGETGVGKSTFINAFVNYLTYDTLDDAMKAKELDCIIPFSFATQVVDKDDPRHPFVTRMVKAGVSKNEQDGAKGESATQRTVVHTVQIGSQVIRLFDTPGIGDTRGAMQDTENMADILSALSNYDKLHGILILLKPNNARLTIMFRFCIKELLTHLHRDAARNMVFGFTNTRASNYKPGDTFEPLKKELTCNKEVQISLLEDTVYCFDSESFRYLAAYHAGIDLENQEDYNRSWERSAHESHRLLTYFAKLTPHQVQDTVSLNETRHLAAELTKPMAEIMQAMNDTIKVNENQIKSLRKDKLNALDLKQQLHVTIRTLQAHKLDHPRTVCAHASCIEYQDDGTDPNKKNLKVVYKTLCHDPCNIDNVPAEATGNWGLWWCSAFTWFSGCKICTHSFRDHLHQLYELKPVQRVVINTDIERKLGTATSEMEVKEIAIAEKEKFIAEIKAEYEQIEGAVIRFTLFLKMNSITAYNDATLEYLGFMIKEEKGKAHVDGDYSKLEELQHYRDKYQERVQTLTERMENGQQGSELLSAQEVQDLVKHLYNLPHYGSYLSEIISVLREAHGDTFREESHPIHVNARVFGGGGTSSATEDTKTPKVTMLTMLTSIKNFTKESVNRFLG